MLGQIISCCLLWGFYFCALYVRFQLVLPCAQYSRKGSHLPFSPFTQHDDGSDTQSHHWQIRAHSALPSGYIASGPWNAFFTTHQKSSPLWWHKKSTATGRLSEEVMHCLPYWHNGQQSAQQNKYFKYEKIDFLQSKFLNYWEKWQKIQ
jgi:hypothetical protein